MCAFVCVCVRIYVCVFVCVCVRVCVPYKSVSAFVRECLRVVSLASPILRVCSYMCDCGRKEGRKNTSKQTFQVFVAAWYAQNVFHVYIMTIS